MTEMAEERLRILFLAHYYPPEIGGGAVRFSALTRWLVRAGHRVTVITGMPNYPSGVVCPAYRGKLAVAEKLDGVEVLRTWVYAAAYRSRVRRLANYLSFVVSAVIRGLVASRRFDVVVAGSPPIFVALAGWLLARFWRVPWVFDIGDLWPDVAVEAGELDPHGLLTRLLYGLARFLYRQASHLTPVTERKRQRLLGCGIPVERISVIENGVDLERVAEAEPGDWRERLGLVEQFVVGYAGLLGIAQGVEQVVSAAAQLADQPDIHFLIVGDGLHRAQIAQRIEAQALDNITLLPALPHAATLGVVKAFDAAWVPLARSELVDAVPSKILEAWACQRPVILSAGGEAAELVRGARGGVVIPPGDVSQLVQAILVLRSTPDQRAQYGDNGYRLVVERFDYQLLAVRMGRLLQRLVESAER